jgi:hypothetical protein
MIKEWNRQDAKDAKRGRRAIERIPLRREMHSLLTMESRRGKTASHSRPGHHLRIPITMSTNPMPHPKTGTIKICIATNLTTSTGSNRGANHPSEADLTSLEKSPVRQSR